MAAEFAFVSARITDLRSSLQSRTRTPGGFSPENIPSAANTKRYRLLQRSCNMTGLFHKHQHKAAGLPLRLQTASSAEVSPKSRQSHSEESYATSYDIAGTLGAVASGRTVHPGRVLGGGGGKAKRIFFFLNGQCVKN